MTVLVYTGTLVQVKCWCGIPHAIPTELNQQARDTDDFGVRCPLGHTWVYRDSYEKQLDETRERLANERRSHEATRDLLAHEERSHATTRGHVTRKKRELARTKAGVCPVQGCHRHFQNLERHMSSKHPGFKP